MGTDHRLSQLKRGKIMFVDDEEKAVKQYISHLKNEGYTNVVYKKDVKSMAELFIDPPDLMFLDITGVATLLSPDDEGIAVLEYAKRNHPWIKTIVLSGSEFPASRAKSLSQADVCVTKGSLTLAQLVALVEEKLEESLAPEYRNAQIATLILERIDTMGLSFWSRYRVRRHLMVGVKNRGDSSFEWGPWVTTTQSLLSAAANAAAIVQLFVQ